MTREHLRARLTLPELQRFNKSKLSEEIQGTNHYKRFKFRSKLLQGNEVRKSFRQRLKDSSAFCDSYPIN